MGKFDLYVGRSVLLATLGVLLLLVGLDALTSIVDETDDMRDGYSFLDILIYVGYTLRGGSMNSCRLRPDRCPDRAGRLAASSELVVIRAAGVSMFSMATMVLKPALLMAAVGFAVGEFVAPHTEQLAMSHRALAQRSESAVAGRFGAWNRDGNTFVHVDAVQRGGVAYGVTLLSFDDDRRLQSTLMAERATHAGDHWVLEQVKLTRLESDRTATEETTLWRWDTAITPQLLTLDVVEPETLPVLELWPYAQYLKQQGMVFVDIELAFGENAAAPRHAWIGAGGHVVYFWPAQGRHHGRQNIRWRDCRGGVSDQSGFLRSGQPYIWLRPLVAALVPIAACWLGGTWLLWRRA